MVDFGSLVNKAKDFARKNPDKLRDGLDKAEHAISSTTGGKFDSQIHSASDKVEQQLGVDDRKTDTSKDEGKGKGEHPDGNDQSGN